MEDISKELKSVAAKSDRAHGTDWLPFWMHSLDTAGIIKKLAKEWLPKHVNAYLIEACGSEERTYATLKFCALVHDIGKITYCFQSKIAQSMANSPFAEHVKLATKPKSGISHGLAGEIILRHLDCPCGIASIVGAHHGKPASNLDELNLKLHYEIIYGREKNEPFFEQLWKEWFDFALVEAGLSSIEELPEIAIPVQVLICALLIMADWIASNTHYFQLIPMDSTLISLETNGSMDDYPARVTYAWEKLQLPGPWETSAKFGLDAEGFAERFYFSPNQTQAEILDIVNDLDTPGILILEAPMGLGKTEAALAMAEVLAAKTHAGGLYFGMPTQATSNGIFPRLEAWASSLSADEGTLHAIRLAHGAAALNEYYRELLEGYSTLAADTEADEKNLFVHEWFSSRKLALMPEFVIGTIDQMLMAALKQKHVMLRHIGLAGKVVVIDECHAYDAYMSTYLDQVIRWLGAYKAPVVILSATLPTKRRVELIDAYLGGKAADGDWQHSLSYPVLTYTNGDEVMQKPLSYTGENKNVSICRITADKIEDTVGEVMAAGGCVGVIVNTVKKAQEIAGTLRIRFADCRGLVLHAQYIMTDRANREKEILRLVGKHSGESDRHKLIVVGTQVLEQSLDLDFDCMITELCPMDLLLQRMGRLHRHARPRPTGFDQPKCYVVDEEDEGSVSVYTKWLLERTRKLLPDTVTIPQDIPHLVEQAYREADEEELENGDWKEAWDEYVRRIGDKESKAKNYLLSKPKKLSKRVQSNVLDGWLDNDIQISEQHGEMAVRDGDLSIDVVALRLCTDGKMRLLVADQDGMKKLETNDIIVPTDRPPSPDESLVIARQKLRLPTAFSKKWNADDVINELEAETKRVFPEWQHTSLLKEELVLLFDEQYHAELDGKTLIYDKDNGLMLT